MAGSGLVLMEYQRNLVSHASEQRKNRNRTQSQSSTLSCEAEEIRRGSATSTDEEVLETDHRKQTKSKFGRRFSLDFLFSKKNKDKNKNKSKRSQSTFEGANSFPEEECRIYRNGSCANAEFALAM